MKGRAQRRIESGGLLPDLHKYVLDGFLGLGGVAENADGNGIERAGGLIVELGKRLLVLRRNAAKQERLYFFSRLSFQHNFRAWAIPIGCRRICTTQLVGLSARQHQIEWVESASADDSPANPLRMHDIAP